MPAGSSSSRAAAAKDVLLWLAEAEVGRQGQRGNQLREPHAGHLACHRREAYAAP